MKIRSGSRALKNSTRIAQMGKRDPRVDAYIVQAAEFARPILTYLREAVHEGCPDVVETLKWSMPFFTRKGILCSMAAFREHCSFGFWLNDSVTGGSDKKFDAMGQFGRISSPKDLPSKARLVAFVREAARLDEAGLKREQKHRPRPKTEVKVPPDLAACIEKNKKAAETFRNFSPSHRREYLEWIEEAKRAETREKRVQQTMVWLTEGKSRNWKYQNC